MKKGQQTPSMIITALIVFSIFIGGMAYFIADLGRNYNIEVNDTHYSETYNYISETSNLVTNATNTFDSGKSSQIEQFTGYLQQAVGATKLILQSPVLFMKMVTDINNDIVPIPEWLSVGVYALIAVMVLGALLYVAMRLWW